MVTDQPAFDGGSVRAVTAGDAIRVSWATPSGLFTRMTLMQCRDNGDSSDVCVNHDVTEVTTLSVSRSNGTLLTLVVWQDRDDVLSYDVRIDSNSGDSGPEQGIYW